MYLRIYHQCNTPFLLHFGSQTLATPMHTNLGSRQAWRSILPVLARGALVNREKAEQNERHV